MKNEKQLTLQKEPDNMSVIAENKSLTPMEMISSAIQSGASIEIMKGLFELQKDWEANEARKAFVKAVNLFKSELPELRKNKKVKFGNTEFFYSPLEEVAKIIGGKLSEHGLSFRWNTENHDKKIKVFCILTHELGHLESTYLEAESDMSGNKNAIQGLGSTITYLQRYTLLAITGMAAKGMDTDGNLPVEYIDETQQKAILKLIDEYKVNPQDFFQFLKIDGLKLLAASRYNDCIAFLHMKKPKDKK